MGALLFIITRTRPDISASVSLAARRFSDSRKVDWEGAKRILIYLKATKELVLFYGRHSEVEFKSYHMRHDADVDFSSTSDRRSASGSF